MPHHAILISNVGGGHTKGRAVGPRELHKSGAPRRPLRQVGRVVGHPPRVRGWVGLLVAMKHGGRVMPTTNFLLD